MEPINSRISLSRLAHSEEKETPTFDDIVEASKAIKEHLETKVEEKIGVAQTELSHYMGKILDKELRVQSEYGKRLEVSQGELQKSINKTLSDSEQRQIKALDVMRENYTKSLQEIEDRYEKRLEVVEKNYLSHGEFLVKSFEHAMDQIKALVGGLQIPPAVVNISPEFKSPDVVVNVPQQSAPVVNVSPEIKSADVVVNVPKTPARRKTFSYDDNGRPLEVREEDIKEE